MGARRSERAQRSHRLRKCHEPSVLATRPHHSRPEGEFQPISCQPFERPKRPARRRSARSPLPSTALNGPGIATARGGKWEAQTVANILRRASIASINPRTRARTPSSIASNQVWSRRATRRRVGFGPKRPRDDGQRHQRSRAAGRLFGWSLHTRRPFRRGSHFDEWVINDSA